MASMHDNAKLYTRKRCYNAATGPYECLSKPWWIKTSKHPIYDPRHNCELEVLNCGEEVFGKLQRDIESAKKTVDIITWGFDPGMVLIRNGSAENGIRYGDLLKTVATRKNNPVLVRLLVWHDDVLSHLAMKNNPSYYSHRFPTLGVLAGFLSEEHERFNAAWFEEMIGERVSNIRLHVREVPLKFRNEALEGETFELGPKGLIASAYPSHHQKMALIDYETPDRAVGYVMGHNSITDFWDTAEHNFRDPRRETLYRKNPEAMRSQIDKFMDEADYFLSGGAVLGEPRSSPRQDARIRKFMTENAFTAKPYQDVSMRVRGPILRDLNHNFCEGWSESRVASSTLHNALWVVKTALRVVLPASEVMSEPVSKKLEQVVQNDPDEGFIARRKTLTASAFKLPNGRHSAQLVRTQPMHQEKGIKECYANLTRQLERYIFLQNQYIQYEDWAGYLKECVQRLRQDGYTRPINVFILTSTPESAGMDLPTYTIAKELGQSPTMVYEHKEAVELAKQNKAKMPITPEQLSKSGINVVMGSLWTCASVPKSAEDYEEIYIHAKVTIVDDVAFTIGSANLNVRSMALDSELNLLSQAMDVAFDLRRELFRRCSDDEGPAQFADMAPILRLWGDLAKNNRAAIDDNDPLTGQLVAFHVDRKPGRPVI